MNKRVYTEFLNSDDTFRVYRGSIMVFSSKKGMLLPILDYIEGYANAERDTIAMDKIIGNAAALLLIKAGCVQVYSPLGSQLAIQTLDTYSIKYQLDAIVPYIRRENQEEMCPMEKLSLNKTPEEFYMALKATLSTSGKEVKGTC